MITEEKIKILADRGVFQRGVSYFNDGAVVEVIQRGQKITAEVQGSDYEPYEVEIILDSQGEIGIADCSCPYGGYCKHVVATLLTLVHTPEAVIRSEAIPDLLAKLPDEQVRRVLQLVLEEHPKGVVILEQEVALLGTAAPTPTASSPATVLVDVNQIARQIRKEFRQAGQGGGYDSWGEYDDGVDVCGIIQPYLDQLPMWFDQHNLATAEAILRATTGALLEGWQDLDEWFQESNEYALTDAGGLLDEAWAELFLSLPAIDPSTRAVWLALLKEWEDEFGDEFAISQTALEQGWDYPPLVAVLKGKISDNGAWEGEVPEYAEELAQMRLRILARQKRFQEYLYLAEAEGQFELLLTMLVQQEEVGWAVQKAQAAYRESLSGILSFAKVLAEKGYAAEALEMASWGLDLPRYHAKSSVYGGDSWAGEKHALAEWLYRHALAVGNKTLALEVAQVAFLHHGTLADYQTAKQLAGEKWPQVQRLLQPRIGQSSQSVQVFLFEGMLPEAMAAFEKSSWAAGVSVKEMVQATRGAYPDWAIGQCVKQAERIMDGAKANDYGEAADWLRLAQGVYKEHGRLGEWQVYLDGLLAKHGRKYKLVPLLKGIR